jgi:hypothetical protein
VALSPPSRPRVLYCIADVHGRHTASFDRVGIGGAQQHVGVRHVSVSGVRSVSIRTPPDRDLLQALDKPPTDVLVISQMSPATYISDWR